jgi:hypothetical protein
MTDRYSAAVDAENGTYLKVVAATTALEEALK